MSRSLLSIVFFFSILLLFSAPAQTEAAEPDQLIKGSTDAVYYLASDQKRYVFANEKIFFSWYQDFSSVQEISDTELASFPVGGSVFYRPGTRLIKITTDPQVYAVGLSGNLYPIISESAAALLYGENWNTKIDDLSDAFFSGYSIGPALNGSQHPPGTVYRYENSSQDFYVTHKDGAVLARVMDKTQKNAYRLQTQFVQIISGAFNYATGNPLQEAELLSRPVVPGESFSEITEEVFSKDASITVQAGDITDPLEAIFSTESTLYEFTVKGDATHQTELTGLVLEFYIDAGGEEKDFLRNTDLDASLERSVSSFVSGVSLYQKETGALIKKLSALPTTAATISVSVPIPANETVTIQVKGDVIASSDEQMRMAVDVLTKLMTFTSPTAASINVSAPERLNGGSSPMITVIPFANGRLTITTETELGNSVYFPGQTPHIFSLLFHADGEGVTVNKFSLQMTPKGDDFLGIQRIEIDYPDKDGQKQAVSADQTTTRYDFSDLHLFIPANETRTVPVTVYPVTLTDDFSNSRIQLDFIQDDFAAITESTNKFFSSIDFLHADRVVDSTVTSPLLLSRYALPSFNKTSDSPSGNANRFNKASVLKFTVEAQQKDIKIEKLKFQIKTSDVDYEGINNDMLEGLLRLDPGEIGSLFILDSEGKEIELTGPSKNFVFFNPSLGSITDTSYESQNGDYGIFIFNFAANPYRITKGIPKTFVFKLNTDTISIENSSTLQIRILGDEQSSSVSEGNFLWDDGTDITANGYLVPGLPLSGGQLSYSRLTTFNP